MRPRSYYVIAAAELKAEYRETEEKAKALANAWARQGVASVVVRSLSYYEPAAIVEESA